VASNAKGTNGGGALETKDCGKNKSNNAKIGAGQGKRLLNDSVSIAYPCEAA